MQVLKFALDPNEVRNFAIAGGRFEVLDASAAFDVDVYDAHGGIVATLRGAEAGWYFNKRFGAIAVRNQGTAQNIELFIADSDGGTKQQPGVVSVVDRSLQSALAGRMWRANTDLAGGFPQSPFQMLRMPAASQSIAVVRSLRIRSAAAQVTLFQYQPGWEPALVGNVPTLPNLVGAPANQANLQHLAGYTGNFGNTSVAQPFFGPLDLDICIAGPLVIRPGCSLGLLCGTNVESLAVTAQFEELAL